MHRNFRPKRRVPLILITSIILIQFGWGLSSEPAEGLHNSLLTLEPVRKEDRKPAIRTMDDIGPSGWAWGVFNPPFTSLSNSWEKNNFFWENKLATIFAREGAAEIAKYEKIKPICLNSLKIIVTTIYSSNIHFKFLVCLFFNLTLWSNFVWSDQNFYATNCRLLRVVRAANIRFLQMLWRVACDELLPSLFNFFWVFLAKKS